MNSSSWPDPAVLDRPTPWRHRQAWHTPLYAKLGYLPKFLRSPR
jgi:hypothetical protein